GDGATTRGRPRWRRSPSAGGSTPTVGSPTREPRPVSRSRTAPTSWPSHPGGTSAASGATACGRWFARSARRWWRAASSATDRRAEMDSEVYRFADRYIDELAALNPLAATRMGVPGYDDRMPDLSPDGQASSPDLVRRTLGELGGAAVESDRDRVA